MTVPSSLWPTDREVHIDCEIAHYKAWGQRSVFLCPPKTFLKPQNSLNCLTGGKRPVLELPKKKKKKQHLRCFVFSHSAFWDIYSSHCKSCKSSPPQLLWMYLYKTSHSWPTQGSHFSWDLFGSRVIPFPSQVWYISFTKHLEQETACKRCSAERWLVPGSCI